MKENIEEIKIPVNSIKLEGILGLPEKSKGIVLFAHGSGSSRFSSRNNFVATVLRDAGLGTLLFDLLTEKEDAIYENRFNIDFITERLIEATKWVWMYPKTKNLKIGYFGASTGAAATLQANAKMDNISAIVSRGGRPDLAKDYLSKVKAPTLLIVGEYDYQVIELNKFACDKINAVKELAIVPKATHLFEEPGALEKVAELAKEWFVKYLN